MSGWRLSCLPHKVYDFLYQFNPHFRSAQGRHFGLFCWLLVALILDQGKGTLKGLSRHLPPRLRHWILLRMVRSGQWDAHKLLSEMVGQVLLWLPAPADGVLYLLGDSTLKQKRGQKHPLDRKARMNESAGYAFGFEMVLLVACWDHYRIPVALAVIDPTIRGHEDFLFRQILQAFESPRWAHRVVALGDAGFVANKTLAVIQEKGYYYVFAMARMRKFRDGKHLIDLVRHLPKSCYRRVASYKPDGRRRDYWVYARRAQLHNCTTWVMSRWFYRKDGATMGPSKLRSS